MKIINTKEVPISSNNINILTNYLYPYLTQLSDRGLEEIKIMQQLVEDCFSHYWYSYDVLNIKYKENYYTIQTNGDVFVNLYNKNDNSIIERVFKFPRNGNIYSLHDYIINDEELKTIIDGKSQRYKINIVQSNWWEINSNVFERKIRNPFYKLKSIYLKDALMETLDIVDSISYQVNNNISILL